MKFIHWTEERNVRRIRHVGIRVSRNRNGKGVCCVPIISGDGSAAKISETLTRVSKYHRDGFAPNNKAHWRWLVQKERRRREAAVIFKLAKPWNCTVTAALSVPPNSELSDLLKSLLASGAVSTDLPIERLNQTHLATECWLEVLEPRALTKLAAHFHSEIWNDFHCDNFEVIIHRPIRAKEIVKIEMRNGYGKTDRRHRLPDVTE